VNDEALAADLVTRMDRDLRARTRDPLDPDEMVAMDAENTAWQAAVLDTEGWPFRSRVGQQAALAAWLLAQHADAQPELSARRTSRHLVRSAR
jgi:hypothetical protein